MPERHVDDDLSAFCQGELDEPRRAAVAAHLAACPRCRGAHEEIRTGIEMAGLLSQVEAPAELWHGIEAALDRPDRRAAAAAPRRTWRELFGMPVVRWAAAAAAVVVIVGLALRSRPVPGREAWSVTALAGAPAVGAKALSGTGLLAVGAELRTDAVSRAALRVADIGTLEVEPSTRLRLVETGVAAHRIALEEGTIHAVVNAPPRLFLVDTPSATAVDLGCAYTLAVGPDGGSLLSVATGWVALEDGGRQSLVPAGAACETRPAEGPGTPYFVDAPAALRAALRAYDFAAGGDDALAAVLAHARRRDALTLWHLLSRVAASGGVDRARVSDALAALVPMPDDVTREGVLALDAGMLTRWREAIALNW
jgi:anti-sigma factor RsiW